MLCKQEGFTKINRSVGSVLEVQQIVTPMNNKAVINNLVLESKFLTCRNNGQPQELGDCDLCFKFAQTEKETYENPVSCHHLTQMLHCLASKHAAVT